MHPASVPVPNIVMPAGLFLAGQAVHYAAGAKRLVPEALALYMRLFQAAAPAGAILCSATLPLMFVPYAASALLLSVALLPVRHAVKASQYVEVLRFDSLVTFPTV